MIAFVWIFPWNWKAWEWPTDHEKIHGVLHVASYTYCIGGGEVVGAILAVRILASNALGLLDNKRKARDIYISLHINHSKSLRYWFCGFYVLEHLNNHCNSHSDWGEYFQILIRFKRCVSFPRNLSVTSSIPLSFLFFSHWRLLVNSLMVKITFISIRNLASSN